MLKEMLQEIKNGGFISIETTKNQYGEEINTQSLYFDSGNWMLQSINCRSSKWEGMGNCNCVSHDPWSESIIDRHQALSIMKEIIKERQESSAAKQEEIEWLNRAISELNAAR